MVSFPLSAVVGMDDLRLALLLNAVSPTLGGVLVRGEKGTAKSTAVRGLAALLAPVEVIEDCRFACDPRTPDPHCPDGPHPTPPGAPVCRPVRLVELPVGASEDRITGSLDLDRALADGVSALRPGLLAAAHRGILYVDEVNLLGDHLVDLLLDAAATGVAHVERDGVSARHAASFLLVGTMNPEEGELRPQLLDRFALTVTVAASRDPATRVEVVRRRLAFDADPHAFTDRFAPAQDRLAARVAAATARLATVTVTDAALYAISAVCAGCDVDGMRADVVLARTAAAHAAWEGRDSVRAADIRAGARLALPHRRRRGPFDAPDMDSAHLDAVLDAALHGLDDAVQAEQAARRAPTTRGDGDGTGKGDGDGPGGDPPGGDGPPGGPDPDGDVPHGGAGSGPTATVPHETERDGDRPRGGPGDGARHRPAGSEDADPGEPHPPADQPDLTVTAYTRPAAPGAAAPPPGADLSGARTGTPGADLDHRRGGFTLTLPRPRPRPAAQPGGAARAEQRAPDGVGAPGAVGIAGAPGALFRPRALAVAGLAASSSAGRRSLARGQRGALVATGTDAPGLHLPATLLAAAPHQHTRGRAGAAPLVRPEDRRGAHRVGREGNLVLFVVDASGSMAARARMSIVTTAVLALLVDAYQRRDRIGMITFRGSGAEVVLAPTSSVEAGAARLAALPTGGRTPLAAGLTRAAQVLRAERRRDPARRALLVVVTDGRATAGEDPLPVAAALRRTAGPTATAHTGTGRSATGAGRGGAGGGLASIVVDCETGPLRLGLAGRLAATLGAVTIPLDALPLLHPQQQPRPDQQPTTTSQPASTSTRHRSTEGVS